MLVAKSFSLKGKEFIVRVYNSVPARRYTLILAEELGKTAIPLAQFQARHTESYKRLLDMQVQLVQSLEQYFPNSTNFNLILVDEQHPHFQGRLSDEFTCVITYPLREFFAASLRFIMGRTSSAFSDALAHELAHYFDYLKQSPFIAALKKAGVQKMVDNQHCFRIVLFTLRQEGFAELVRRRESETVLLSSQDLTKYRKDLQRLVYSFDLERPQLWKVYRQYFQEEAYAMGFLMVFIIALAYYHRQGGRSVYLKNGQEVQITEVNSLFRQNVEIKNIPLPAIHQAIAAIRLENDEEFLQHYERSCILLGIKKRYRLLWWNLYVAWNKTMHDDREKFVRGELRRAELRPQGE